MEKVTFSIRKGVQIQSKTTCFASMKAYENKNFAFTTVTTSVSNHYEKYEGKINFRCFSPVELEGVEPSSKRGNHTLSTRLSWFLFSCYGKTQATNRNLIP